MKKIVFAVAVTLCITSSYAQISYGYQFSGLNGKFYITQAGHNYEAVRWVFGDGSELWINFDTVYHTYAAPAIYNVCVYGYPMPVNPVDSSCKDINLLGSYFEEIFSETEANLYLIERQLIIEFIKEPSKTSLCIFDQNSRKVIDVNINKLQTTIDLHFLKSGIYFIRLENKGKVVGRKVWVI